MIYRILLALLAAMFLSGLAACQDNAGPDAPKAEAAAPETAGDPTTATPSGQSIPEGAFAPQGLEGASVVVRTAGRAEITAVDGHAATVSQSAANRDYDRILLPPGEHIVHVGNIDAPQGVSLGFTGSAGDYYAVLLTYIAKGETYWAPVIVGGSPQGRIVADQNGLLVGKSPAEAAAILTVKANETRQPERAEGGQNEDLEAKTAQAKANLAKGTKLFQEKNFEAALAAFDAALEIAPGFDVALVMRGMTLARLKQPNAAIKSLDRAIESGRSTRGVDAEWLHWPYFEIGAILTNAGKPDLALDALGESIRLKPTVKALGIRASIYFKQGEALGKKNDWDGARPFFQKAQADAVKGIGLQPEAVRLWAIKTGTHVALNEHEQACQSMRQACELGDCSIIEQYPQCKPGGT